MSKCNCSRVRLHTSWCNTLNPEGMQVEETVVLSKNGGKEDKEDKDPKEPSCHCTEVETCHICYAHRFPSLFPSSAKKETDPHGKSQHEPGAKLDAGKPRLSLVLGGFSRALAGVGVIGTDGAAKYVDNGWVHVPDGIARYLDAGYRHMLEYFKGEIIDPNSGSPHLDHANWNFLAASELIKREEEKNGDH